MPSGDTYKIWFPEIVEALRTKWKSSLSWEDFIALRNLLDSNLQSIRSERNILSPMMWCPECKTKERSEFRAF